MTKDPRAVLTRAAPPPDLTFTYGDHPDHVIDLRLPPPGRERRRLIVFIHGGFWRAIWNREHAAPLAADLAARGWPVASIEFRRVGQEGGGWPGTFDDVRAALDAIPRLVAQAGVDGERPIIAGHSAGGHLALWYAAERPEMVTGVLALAPVCDLVEGAARRLGDGAVAALLGGEPDEVPARYTAADPAARGRLGVPAVLVHGAEDDIVPVELSRGYAPAAGAELVELRDIDHFGVIDPESPAWTAVLSAVTGLDQGLTRSGPRG